jgi:hypothetical protein
LGGGRPGFGLVIMSNVNWLRVINYALSSRTFWTQWAESCQVKLTSHPTYVLAGTIRSCSYIRKQSKEEPEFRNTNRACRILVCNRDTLHVVPLGARIDIHPRLNSSHILRTTSTLACAAGYIRARTRKHLLFCRDREANVCRR